MTDYLRFIRYAVFVALLVMVLALGNVLFVDMDQVTEPLYASFISLNFGSMFVGVCMMGALVLDKHYGPYNRISVVVLSGMIIVILMDTLALFCWKVLGLDRMTFIFHNIEYYLISLFLFVLMLSLKTYIDPKPKPYRMYLLASFVPMFVEAVLLTQNITSHNLWHMEFQAIQYGPLYPVVFVAPLVQNLLYLIACIQLSRNKKQGVIFASLMFFSFISVFVMYPNYYSTVNCLVTIFPLLLVIPYEYARRGKELRKTTRALKEKGDAMKISQINMGEIDSTLLQLENMSGMPDQVAEALGKFRKFLKENYTSFNNPSMVPMEKELEYTKTYLYLEKLRFKKRLEVEYHINTTSFEVPSFAMQVLVENAVKHGISKRPEGGKVIITVDSFKGCYMIIVEDNGVGFDVNAPRNTDRSHIGIDNIRARVADMAGGQLEIESTVGIGTTSTVIIPKKGQEQ